MCHLQALALPELPLNAKYVRHTGKCSDWGTYGWVLETQGITSAAYKHFIFLNSSVRGPYMPAYLKARPALARLDVTVSAHDHPACAATLSCYLKAEEEHV